MTGVVLAVDPGPTSGFVLLAPGCPPLAYSCNHRAAYGLACFLISSAGNGNLAVVTAAGEEFREGRGAGARRAGGQVTRQVIADLSDLLGWHWRPAVTVKAWATDKRLLAAGLYDLTAKMPDSRDAARHSLYAAVHDAGWPDPLSKDGPAFWGAMC